MNKKIWLFSLLLTPLTSIGCNKSNPLNTPLFIECVDGSTAIKYIFEAEESAVKPDLQCSYDCKQWEPINVYVTHEEEIKIADLTKGQKIYFRGDNSNGFNYYNFDGSSMTMSIFNFKFIDSTEVKLKIGGNIMSLLSIDKFSALNDIPCDGCFYQLFNCFSNREDVETDFGNVDASELLLPAVNLKDYTYCYTFLDASLSKTPKSLPAETAKKGVYESMFGENKHLVTAPIINLKNLEESSCRDMFCGCLKLDITKDKDKGRTKIFTCPELNGEGCVANMFYYTKDLKMPDPIEGEVYYFN